MARRTAGPTALKCVGKAWRKASVIAEDDGSAVLRIVWGTRGSGPYVEDEPHASEAEAIAAYAMLVQRYGKEG